jgi:hypothetical protein
MHPLRDFAFDWYAQGVSVFFSTVFMRRVPPLSV